MDMRVVSSRKGFQQAAAVGVVLVAALLVPMATSSVYYRNVFTTTFLFIIVTAGLRLIYLTGQTSMGQAGFMGVGAYLSAVLAKETGISPFATMIFAMIGTFVLAFLVGLLFARLRGVYFSMITLFFGIALLGYYEVLSKWTGGRGGLLRIPPLFTGADRQIKYYYFILIVMVVALLIMYRLEHSRIGVRWRAISQSYVVAGSIGIPEYFERVLAFSIGCAFAGLAGGLFAHFFGVLAFDGFSFLSSIEFLVYMLTGGVGSFAGPVVGTAVLVIIPEVFRALQEYRLFLVAGIMLVVLFLMPRGLAGLPRQLAGHVQTYRDKKRGVGADVA